MPTQSFAELIHCGSGTLIVLWALTLIASATCGLLIYSIASFRNTMGHSTALFGRRTVTEILWAMIPILILIGSTMPSVKMLITADASCNYSR